jgi:predicted permease
MSTLLQDLRHAARLLRKSPGLTATVVVTLGLGIGAGTTIFSFVSALLLKPLPVAEPASVVAVFTSDHSGPRYGWSSYPDYLDFEKTDVFAGLAAHTVAPLSLTQGGHTDRVFGELVTANYFVVAGVGASRGRLLVPEDGLPGAPPVLVVGDALWRRAFAADPGLVGRSVTLNGQPFSVVGIAPRGFAGMTRGMAVDLWVPVTAPGAIPSADRLDNRGSRWLLVLGRLKPGVAARDAEARLAVLAGQLQQAYPDNWTDVRRSRRVISVVPESQARIFPQARGAVVGFLGLLLAVVGLVLMIACSNVASLLLARAGARRRETAVRLALGASRGRLVRQLLTESLVLSLLAGALGVLLASWATDLLMALRPPVPFPVALDLELDGGVLAFSLTLAILTGLGFGLVPALQASRAELLPALKDETPGSGRASAAYRRPLVVAQMAMSAVLLIGAGLFLQSLRNAHAIDPGFDPGHLLLLSTDLRLNGYPEPAGRDFYRRLLERAGALPGARAASLATGVPLGLGSRRRNVAIEGYQPAAGEDMEVHTNSVGPGYFRTMGVALARGRDFGASDGPGAPGVAIVNEAFARRYWPGQDPIGKTLRLGSRGRPAAEPFTVVGLARDGKYVTLGEEPKPFFYVPFLQLYEAEAVLHVRTQGDPRALVAALRREVQALDPSVPIYDVKTMTDHLGVALLPARLAAGLLGAFGVLAIVLAALGLYGLMAHSVSQRTRELGIRMALGARAADLLSMVLGQGLGLTGLGVAAGLPLAFAVTRLAANLLYGISPTDPLTFTGIALLLAATALLASYVPARRATRVDPIVALRYE